MNQPEKSEMESRILEAAKTVFIRKGFESATMGDIAAEAAIGRTSLNYYYRTKEMLFEQILGDMMEMLLPNIERIVDEPTSYGEKVRQIVRTYISTIRENKLFPFFVVSELHRDPEHLIRYVTSNRQRLRPFFKLRQFATTEMIEGRLKRMPLVDLASTVISLIVFPFLVRRPLIEIFLDGEAEEFEKFLDRRTDFICAIADSLLKQDDNI